MWKAIGSAFIKGSGWCGHLLNVDAANVSSSQVFILGMLLTVHGNCNLVGPKGEVVLVSSDRGHGLTQQPQCEYFHPLQTQV